MIYKRKTVIVLISVWVLCFAFFGFIAKYLLPAAAENRKSVISDCEENIKLTESMLTKSYDKSDTVQNKERQSLRERIDCLQGIIDGINKGHWEKRVQNSIRRLESELNGDNQITAGRSEAQNELALDKALIAYRAAPRDFAEDGISSIYAFLKDWLFFLLPLCAMLLTSDLIAGERASGSIKLLLQKRKTRAWLYARKFRDGLWRTLAAVLSAALGAFAGGTIFGAGIGSLNYPVLYRSGYEQTWKIFLLCLPILLLSSAFYTTLGLFLSTLFHSRALSVAASTAGVFAFVFFGRKTVTATCGNLWQLSPFECSDVLTTVLGKFSVPDQETLTSPAVGLTAINLSGFTDIPAALPLWGCVLMLSGWFALFLIIGICIFKRKDLV